MTTAHMPFPLTHVRASSDAQDRLVERVARGEPSAIGEVYDLHGDAIRLFARRLLGEDAAAEDLVHDVFVALPAATSRFRGDASLRTFLFSIAVNQVRHHVRGASRRRAAMDRLAREPGSSEAASPERDVRRAELARALTRALDRLPIDQRVAFVLCEVEERTAAEAAQITRAPEATMRTRLFHAKRKLRDLLSREGVR